MNWKRERPGVYTAGPYLVERFEACDPHPNWYASGPGHAGPHYLKTEAQAACERVMALRAADPDANAPVVGDIVEIIADGRRGQVSTILPSRGNHNELTRQPLFCLRLARGKRLCLFRHEIKVVTP